MTLAYEDRTIDRADGVSESPAAGWTAAMSDRQDDRRGSSLAALEGMPISSRFCSWIGLSGRRYVFSVYPASECPAFRDSVLLTVVRDMTGRRRVMSVRETGLFPEPVVEKAQREFRAFGPGVEFHLHLLATSPTERAATVADLAIAQA
ncbi:MAG: hypothetical protein WCF81_21560 [Roseiarcus sp.]